MTDPFVLRHVARILRAVGPKDRADLVLRQYFEREKRLTAVEKRNITHAVFRYYRWVQWLDRDAPIERQVEEAQTLQGRFVRDPQAIKAEALDARAVPDWLRGEMDLPPGYVAQLQRDPALWIRARPDTAAKLSSSLGDCHSTGLSPDALRYTGTKDLFRTPEFQAGAFEIQDLASQLVGVSCAPQAGQTWWDACAGEGGKTLHLADQMRNKGLIWASDRSGPRLESLKRRAARARIFNYRTVAWDGGVKLPTKTKFDGILVDAPCSGVGTWQRNPHARWTTSLDDVRELAAIQLQLLNRVAGALKPGGKLVYSVCTLTRSENSAVTDAFSAAHPEMTPVSSQLLRPQEIDANGMYIATWTRGAQTADLKSQI